MYKYVYDGIVHMQNPISFSSKILCGVAFEQYPRSWRVNNLCTVQTVYRDDCTLSQTVAYVMYIDNGGVVRVGDAATYAIVFGV